jgi:enoyl-CoA hydratase/carnithine racemase
LINEICRREELLPRAIELAQEIADNAPLSVQMVKQIVSGENKPMVFEALVGALVASSEDGREGIASFREKRPTNYQGK